MATIPDTAAQLQSLVTAEGELQLSIAQIAVPQPKEDQVLIRVEAAPINPSDLGLLFGGTDMSSATASGSADAPLVRAPISPGVLSALAGRVGEPMPVGNEGAGTVVKAGKSEAAQALKGKTVSMIGGGMYTQYRLIRASDCQALRQPAGHASRRVHG